MVSAVCCVCVCKPCGNGFSTEVSPRTCGVCFACMWWYMAASAVVCGVCCVVVWGVRGMRACTHTLGNGGFVARLWCVYGVCAVGDKWRHVFERSVVCGVRLCAYTEGDELSTEVSPRALAATQSFKNAILKNDIIELE